MLRDNADYQAHIAGLTPLGHHAVADHIGPVIANLLSPDNGWVTGQRIDASRGMRL